MKKYLNEKSVLTSGRSLIKYLVPSLKQETRNTEPDSKVSQSMQDFNAKDFFTN